MLSVRGVVGASLGGVLRYREWYCSPVEFSLLLYSAEGSCVGIVRFVRGANETLDRRRLFSSVEHISTTLRVRIRKNLGRSSFMVTE